MTIEVPRTIPAAMQKRIDLVERRINRIDVAGKDPKRLEEVVHALERLAEAVGRPVSKEMLAAVREWNRLMKRSRDLVSSTKGTKNTKGGGR